VEPAATGDEHRDVVSGADERAYDVACGEDLLEVVEDEQRPATAQEVDEADDGIASAAIGQAELLGDRRSDELGLGDRAEGHEPDPVRRPRARAGRDGEPRLARAAGPVGQEPPLVDQAEDLVDLGLPSEKVVSWVQQVRRHIERPQRREGRRQVVHDELAEHLGRSSP
jgi:hypothetical protein